jgi:glycosyltransferase involved in cell wall biosynthesis
MDGNKKTVLLIIPNLNPGGAQNVFRQHLEFLSESYSVHGCVFNWDGALSEQWPFPVHSLQIPAGNNLLTKVYYFLKRVVGLRALKKKIQPHISISHLEGADYVNILSRQTDKIVLWIHGTKQHDANIHGAVGWFRKQVLMTWLYKKANKIVCVSQALQHEFKEFYPATSEKLLTIYNGFDLDRIKRLSTEPVETDFIKLCQDHFVIITHCRLALQKNLTAFIQLAALLKQHSSIKWVIIGDGEERAHLLKQCSELKLRTYERWGSHQWNPDDQLFFLGYHQNPYAFLRHASLYLMTSGWEGFPLALCEALACGLPAMATDCPTGPREILTSGATGRTLSPGVVEFGMLLPLLNHPSSIQESSRFIEEVHKQPSLLNTYRDIGPIRVQAFTISQTHREIAHLMKSLI